MAGLEADLASAEAARVAQALASRTRVVCPLLSTVPKRKLARLAPALIRTRTHSKA